MKVNGLEVLYSEKIMGCPPNIEMIVDIIMIILVVSLICGVIIGFVSMDVDNIGGAIIGLLCIIIAILCIISFMVIGVKYGNSYYTGKNIYGCSINGQVDLKELNDKYIILNQNGNFIEIKNK